MIQPYDVAIIGLGAMGSAAAYHLARRGQHVLGLDRFTPPHEQGSSHGHTRIIREAYFEHPLYVPLVQRAYELWDELEQATEQQLFRPTGGLMIGPPDGELVQGAQHSAHIHNLTHEVLTAAEVQERFPALRPTEGMVGVWEPRAGVLFPEACIAAHLELAHQHGATLRFDEPITAWQADAMGTQLSTAQGQYRARRLLFCAGAWLKGLVPELSLPIWAARQVLFWFEPAGRADTFHPDRCPVYLWEHTANRFFYGFPQMGEGVKVAIHHEGQTTEPDTLRRDVSAEETEAMRALLQRFMPDAVGALQKTAVCLYTNTSDYHFLLDVHPHCPQVFIASPCSGHGFKFSSAIGELLADLLTTGNTPYDISLFQMNRFTTE